ncbi:MAG: hypothetical protein DMF93_16380 [Acidobacteria bacterium]|nr:MAG: hypothetical protein DMF93_16380 [Acidobacteriota bacterium]
MSDAAARKISDDLLRPLLRTSWRFYALVAFLGAIVAAGLATWMYQVWMGFGMTGINMPVYWAFYITNFVFWIGISHAGTLISAILRLVNAGWRRPVTRCAEVITAFALMIGAMFPIIHLGRPWLFFWLMPYPSNRMIWPNFRSPLVWDFFAISTYLTGSVLFLVLPMIPDFALVRDRTTGLRRKAYGVLALGWRGTPKQWHRLESAMQIMAIAIIPVAVSVHTIVSFDFSMAPVPMWHSTMFGPPAPRGIPAPGALPEPRQAAADDEPAVDVLRLRRAAHRLVRQRERRGAGAARHAERHVRAALLDDGRLQFRRAVHDPLAAAPADDHRLRDRLLLRLRRHVARALPDRRAVARAQVPPVHVGHVSAAARRDHDHDLDLRRDGAALHAVREVRPHHLGLGAEGRRARRARAAAAARRARHRRGAAVSAVYGLFPTPEAAQRAVNGLRSAGIGDARITVISSEPFEEHEFAAHDHATWMGWIALGGAIVGLASATWLTRMTELAWPLPTGNMPIVAWWPNLTA